MLYDIGTRPGERLPVGILEHLFKPPTAQSVKTVGKPNEAQGSKPGSRTSKRSQASLFGICEQIFHEIDFTFSVTLVSLGASTDSLGTDRSVVSKNILDLDI